MAETALVTCASGCVGRAFLRILRERGVSVRAWIRDTAKAPSLGDAEVVIGDLFDPAICRRACAGVATVIHIPPRVYPTGDQAHQLAEHCRSHSETTRRLLAAGEAAGARRFLYISSAHAGLPTPYGIAKREAERCIEAHAAQWSAAVILRPPSIYGDGDKGILTPLKKAAVRGLPLPLRGIAARHSIVFADDLARAGWRLLEAPMTDGSARTFVIKDPDDYSPEELYEACCRSLAKSARCFWLPQWILRRVRPFPVFLRAQCYSGEAFAARHPDFRFTPLLAALGKSLNHLATIHAP
ncbi:MAG: NAD-dependent epimerase/dehydratase family protein [Deltaproteobacteria bacterium]|nr:NAD-dependent epimerase/dehydratase family protein [Deltaproteobacteria bacterium]